MLNLGVKSKQQLKKYLHTLFQIIVPVEAPNRLVVEILDHWLSSVQPTSCETVNILLQI